MKNENCNIIFANENDPPKAFRINFPDINMINKDIRDLHQQEIENLIGTEEAKSPIMGTTMSIL